MPQEYATLYSEVTFREQIRRSCSMSSQPTYNINRYFYIHYELLSRVCVCVYFFSRYQEPFFLIYLHTQTFNVTDTHVTRMPSCLTCFCDIEKHVAHSYFLLPLVAVGGIEISLILVNQVFLLKLIM